MHMFLLVCQEQCSVQFAGGLEVDVWKYCVCVALKLTDFKCTAFSDSLNQVV